MVAELGALGLHMPLHDPMPKRLYRYSTASTSASVGRAWGVTHIRQQEDTCALSNSNGHLSASVQPCIPCGTSHGASVCLMPAAIAQLASQEILLALQEGPCASYVP